MKLERPLPLLLLLGFVTLTAPIGQLHARGNPVVPVLGGNASRGVAPVPSEFVCGTYRGSENQAFWFHSLYEARRAGAAQAPLLPSADFVSEDVWVVEDDGSILFSGTNVFDTDFQSFHFAPNPGGGYDVTSIPFAFDPITGSNLGLGDDANVVVPLGFSFGYFDSTWTAVHANANGAVAFGAVMNPSGFFSSDDFFSGTPKIAAYLMDLNPAAGGGVFHKGGPTKSTFTWNNVPEFGTGNLNRLQLVLHDDGSFDVTFAGIASTLSASGQPTIFGIHPGGAPPLEVIGFSSDLPHAGAPGAGIYENYLNITNPLVNEVALLQRFYQSFPDSFFQLIFFTNFPQTMGGFANERNIKNDVQGIGLGVFDNSALYGSSGVLESRCNMNRLAAWPTDPTTRFFGDGNNFLTIMGQESGHRWGAFVNFVDSLGSVSNLILGRSDAHWSYFFDTDHSCLEGGNWEPLGGGTFIVPTKIDFFGDLDEYIFGFRLPDEVKTSFFVSSPTNNLPGRRDDGTPVQGATATGTAVTVTIDDIIAAEGPRIPAEPAEEKDLRQGFILIVQNGTTPTAAELAQIVSFRRAWEDYFEVAMDGRMTVNTSLSKVLPVASIAGHVLEGGTLVPLADVTLRSLERGFTQFVPGGGRYTFRYMADSLSHLEEMITVVASAEGFRPDTLVTSIPYGTQLGHDFVLYRISTGVEDAALPGAYALHQNVPNPFNPVTSIEFSLPEQARVRLAVYNVRGERIRTLVDATVRPGRHAVLWNGRDDEGHTVASGIYFYRIETPAFTETKKLTLLK